MRITERRLRRIIKSVIREAYEDDIYASFPSPGYEEGNIVDYTDMENFPEGEINYDYYDEEEIEGPFGMTPEEREELYQSRELSDDMPFDMPDDISDEDQSSRPRRGRRKVGLERSAGPISSEQERMARKLSLK